jgi:HEAT repeats
MHQFLRILCTTMVVFSISATAADMDGPTPYRPMSIAARSELIRSEPDNLARERLADNLLSDVKLMPPSMIDEGAIDWVISLLNDDSDAVRDNVAMAIAAIGPRARKATPALEDALELARQYRTFVAERNFIFSGFPIFTGPSSAHAICHALKEIGAPDPMDCFNGYYDPIIETPPDQR